jgi:hypothetical protein
MFATKNVGAQTCSLLQAAYKLLDEQPGVGAIQVALRPAYALPTICIATHSRRIWEEPEEALSILVILAMPKNEYKRLLSAIPVAHCPQALERESCPSLSVPRLSRCPERLFEQTVQRLCKKV